MTKDVLVSIKGLQYSTNIEEDEDQRVETLNRAQYALRNGHDFIVYDECLDTQTVVKNVIKFCEGVVEVTRRGPYNVHMLFEEGKKNFTNYNTPYGEIVIGIETEKITIDRKDEEICVNICYDMEMNYEFVAKSEIEIHVSSI